MGVCLTELSAHGQIACQRNHDQITEHRLIGYDWSSDHRPSALEAAHVFSLSPWNDWLAALELRMEVAMTETNPIPDCLSHLEALERRGRIAGLREAADRTLS